MLLLFRNRGGGGLPPDNGFGLLSITTTRSGTFQAQTVTKTGAPLRWWWGDGTFSDGNNPSKVYPDSSEKTIYVATTDGWSGLTDIQISSLTVTAIDVAVASNLQIANFQGNQIATISDTSNHPALEWWLLGGNELTTVPDVSTNTSLVRLFLHQNNLQVVPNVSSNLNLQFLFLFQNLLPQAQLDTLIDQCWQNRVALGGNSCDIRIQSNANPPGATAIAQIEGTGIYAGDGLIDNGCSVTY